MMCIIAKNSFNGEISVEVNIYAGGDETTSPNSDLLVMCA